MQAFFYICEYLDVTPKDFWDFDNETPKKMEELNTHLEKLNSEQLDVILNLNYS